MRVDQCMSADTVVEVLAQQLQSRDQGGRKVCEARNEGCDAKWLGI